MHGGGTHGFQRVRIIYKLLLDNGLGRSFEYSLSLRYQVLDADIYSASYVMVARGASIHSACISSMARRRFSTSVRRPWTDGVDMPRALELEVSGGSWLDKGVSLLGTEVTLSESLRCMRFLAASLALLEKIIPPCRRGGVGSTRGDCGCRKGIVPGSCGCGL